MKIKLTRTKAYKLEDALLDLYFGLDTKDWEGNTLLGNLIDSIQDKINKEDIDGEGV